MSNIIRFMIVIVFLGVVSRFNMYRIKKNYNDLIKNYDENKYNQYQQAMLKSMEPVTW